MNPQLLAYCAREIQSKQYPTFAEAARMAWDYGVCGYRVSVGRSPGEGWRVAFK